MNDDPKSRYNRDQLLIDDPTQDEATRQQARLRQAFWQARFKKIKKEDFYADTFIGLWSGLIINSGNSRSFGGKRRILKEVEKFFAQPLLAEAIKLAGDSAGEYLFEELKDSARIYLESCRNDSHFGSFMLGLMKLKPKDIANKAAKEAAVNMIAILIEIGQPKWSRQMIQAVWETWGLVFSDYPDLLAEQLQSYDADISQQALLIVSSNQNC